MTVQLYVAFKSVTLNVELVPKESVLVPFVHLYPVGVVIVPLTLSVTANVAVPVAQFIAVGVIVTTASGPVSPFSPTYLDHVYELAVVGAVALVPL